MGLWTCGLWVHGAMGLWACVPVFLWACGHMGPWACGCMGARAVWGCGPVGLWTCGFLNNSSMRAHLPCQTKNKVGGQLGRAYMHGCCQMPIIFS